MREGMTTSDNFLLLVIEAMKEGKEGKTINITKKQLGKRLLFSVVGVHSFIESENTEQKSGFGYCRWN